MSSQDTRILFSKQSLLWPLLIIYIFLVFSMPQSSHRWDNDCWRRWANFILENGLQNAYDCYGLNYLPGYLYVLYLFGKFHGVAEDVTANLYMLKAITLLFDFAGIMLALRFVKNESNKLLCLIFGLFNIGYLYNTLIWNQVDAIFTCFVFASLLMAFRKNFMWSLIWFIIALNFKLQAIIFLPLIGLLWLPLLKKLTPRRIAGVVITVLLIQTVIVLPWLLNGSLKFVWQVATGSVGFFPRVSMNAFNFWHLAVKGDLLTMSDAIVYAGLTYKQWGLIMFLLFSLLAFMPVLKQMYHWFVKKQIPEFSISQVLIIAALIPLLFFFFNTQMHERYCHPAILFLTAYAFYSGSYGPLVLVSVAYTLNLERVLHFLNLYNYETLVFDRQFIALLFLAGIVWLFIRLYKDRSDLLLKIT